jgi:hypothetical protein
MLQFVSERDMPDVGQLGPDQLKDAAQGSCAVLRIWGPTSSGFTATQPTKIYSLYRAPDDNLVRQHAANAGFPTMPISQVRAATDPTTAE